MMTIGLEACRQLNLDVATGPEIGKTMAEVDSWRINISGRAMLIDRVLDDVRAGRGSTVFTINLDHLARLRRDAEFREVYRRARWVSADGMPVVMLARAGGAEIERVTGADLVEPLCEAAARSRVPVFFFGASDEVLAVVVDRLRRKCPDLIVAGVEAPAMGFDPRGAEAAAAVKRIVASGAGICFVALGAPKQELFADGAMETSDGITWLGVGAAFDFLAGRRRRAPRILQMLSLEWAWRALQEPRRLIPRYFDDAVWLIGYVGRLLLHGGGTGTTPSRPRDDRG